MRGAGARGASLSGIERAGRRALLRWMILVRRRAVTVVVLAALVAAASLALAATRLSIDTNLSDMLSSDLPYRRDQAAMTAAFPQLERTLTVVVEAASAEAAAAAAGRLAEDLGGRPEVIRDVDYPEGAAFFRRNGLLYLEVAELQALADRLAEIQPLLSSLKADPSLGGLAAVLAPVLEAPSQAAAAALAPALDAMAASAEAAAEGRLRALSWRALAAGQSGDAEAAGDTHRAFLIARPVLNFQSLQPAKAASEAIHRAAATLDDPRLADPVLGKPKVRVTGELAMRDDELRSLRDSMGLVSLVSLALVVVLLALGLRSVWLIVAMVATLGVGLLATAGFAALAIGQLNVISVAFAVLFIGLSVDFGIHFALRYQEGLAGAHGGAAALCRAAVGVGGALTLAALAAAIGFFSFLPTAYRGLAELGLIAGVGMFIALACNLTLLPALLTLLPGVKPRARRPGRGGATGGATGWVGRLAQRADAFLARRPRAVLLAALALGLAAAAAVPFARFDDDPLNLRDPNSPSVATLLDLFDDPNIDPYAAGVLVENLDQAARLAPRLEALAEVGTAESLLSAIPDDQDEKLLVIEDMAIFLTPLLMPSPEPSPETSPETSPEPAAARELAAAMRTLATRAEDPALAGAARRFGAALAALAAQPERLALLETALFAWLPALIDRLGTALMAEPIAIDDLPQDFRARWLAADGQARIEIRPAEDLRDQAARHRFVRAVRAVAPNASGATVEMTEGGRAVIDAYRQAAATAVVAIALLLLVLLRRLAAVVLVLAPLLLAAVLTVAATVVFALPFNFANVIVLPLLFGLGVASGLHIELRARQAGPQRVLSTSTPRAVLFSALTTVASFGALALSRHTGTASMGVLLTIAICLTLVSTLVVLPALLHEAGRWRQAR